MAKSLVERLKKALEATTFWGDSSECRAILRALIADLEEEEVLAEVDLGLPIISGLAVLGYDFYVGKYKEPTIPVHVTVTSREVPAEQEVSDG